MDASIRKRSRSISQAVEVSGPNYFSDEFCMPVTLSKVISFDVVDVEVCTYVPYNSPG